MGAQPDEVTGDTLQLDQRHPRDQRLLRDRLDPQELFYR